VKQVTKSETIPGYFTKMSEYPGKTIIVANYY